MNKERLKKFAKNFGPAILGGTLIGGITFLAGEGLEPEIKSTKIPLTISAQCDYQAGKLDSEVTAGILLPAAITGLYQPLLVINNGEQIVVQILASSDLGMSGFYMSEGKLSYKSQVRGVPSSSHVSELPIYQGDHWDVIIQDGTPDNLSQAPILAAGSGMILCDSLQQEGS